MGDPVSVKLPCAVAILSVTEPVAEECRGDAYLLYRAPRPSRPPAAKPQVNHASSSPCYDLGVAHLEIASGWQVDQTITLIVEVRESSCQEHSNLHGSA